VFDVIVVGARCAGAATALLLARRGHRVLLVDRSRFPSDLVLSTHLVWQPGVARLSSWRLGEALAGCGAPALTTGHFDLGRFAIDAAFPAFQGVSQAYAPRRIVLDHLLVEAATRAGAELSEATTVRELQFDGDAVTGVRAAVRGGAQISERARIVVGADGTHSVVARLVAAPEYHTVAPLAGTYFSYWSDVPLEGVEFYPRTGRAVYGWPTNEGLSLIGANWVAADFPSVRADIERNYRQVLGEAAPDLADRVVGGTREAPWIGGMIRGYFRRPHGPGWALVGDAGYQKDPGTAQGITDALTHAELLANAIHDGLTGTRPLSQALVDYERARNDHALPRYQLTCQLGALAPPTPDRERFYAALGTDPELAARFFGVFAGSVPAAELFPAPT